jgi:hypothetical protein
MLKPKMIWVPAGDFVTGAPVGEAVRLDVEGLRRAPLDLGRELATTGGFLIHERCS